MIVLQIRRRRNAISEIIQFNVHDYKSPSKKTGDNGKNVADDVAAAMAQKLEKLLTENVELKMKLATSEG